MNTVEPIRDVKKIIAIKNNLKKEKNPRNYLLFVLGINSALRISDLLKLKVKDVLNNHGNIKENIYIRQKKTGKEVKPKINKAIREALEFYFERIGIVDSESYLFSSTKNNNKPIDRIQCWRLIQKWCEDVSLETQKNGTHTLRKTWGFHARKNGVSLDLIMSKLGQNSTNATKRYIGITQKEVNEIEEKVCL